MATDAKLLGYGGGTKLNHRFDEGSIMYGLTLSTVEKACRTIALCTSAAAAALFASLFAAEDQVAYQLELFLQGKQQDPGLAIYLGLLVTIFIGYALAAGERLSKAGGILALAGVVAVFAWCELKFNFGLHPVQLLLAGPAVFHLLFGSVQSRRRSKETVATEIHSVDFEAPLAEVPHVERELVAGAV